MSADPFESSSRRLAEPAVLFYVSEDEHANDEVEHLIRTAEKQQTKPDAGQVAVLPLGDGEIDIDLIGAIVNCSDLFGQALEFFG